MPYLEENEWILLNELVYDISFIYSLRDMQEYFLRLIKLLVRYDAGIFSLIKNGGSLEFEGTAALGLTDKYIKVWEHEAANNDYAKWIVDSPRACAFREAELIPEKQRTESEFFKAFNIPCKLHYGMVLCVAFRGESTGILHFLKSMASGDFADRDLFVLDQLHKHLAYRLSYEANKGNSRYFYAKGSYENLCRRYSLTRREGEIFRCAIQGLSNADISKQMDISVHTVKKHFCAIYEKMGVNNRVQLLQALPLSTDKIDFDEL